MVKRVLSVSRISIKLVAFITCICMVSEVSAGLIVGSENTVTITGNNPNLTNGSFVVQVDYAVYDGVGASNPLPADGDYQIEFVLTHLGGDGETPVLDIARLVVFAPDSLSHDPFYTGMGAVGSGMAPLDYYNNYDTDGVDDGMFLELPVYNSGDGKWYGSNNAQFIFIDYYAMADFGPAYYPTYATVSQQLVVKVAPENLPATVWLEIDTPDAAGVDGSVEVEFIPEPASVVLFGVGSFLLSLRRRRKA